MDYIISENQYRLITEALGVPETILETAEDFYEIFKQHLKSIKEKRKKYNFNGISHITLGGKSKVNLKSYDLTIEVKELDSFTDSPKIYSMGMAQNFMFDKDIMLKRTIESDNAKFSISYAVGPNWSPEQLYEEFENNPDKYISSIAHELKHKYDKQINKIGLIGKEAEYAGVQESPRFGIPVIDQKFLHYLYYTDVAESLVRPTELASRMKVNRISQDQFRDFIKNDETFLKLVDIKNFTFEELVEGIRQNMGRVNEIIEMMGADPEDMPDNEKIEEILRLVYVNLSNTKINEFTQMVQSPMDGFANLLSVFGMGQEPMKQTKIDQMVEKFYNYILRYQDNPIQYFKDEIENFHKVANQMIKKLGKLYAMSSKPTTESIIDWNLHQRVLDQNNVNVQIESSFRSKLKK